MKLNATVTSESGSKVQGGNQNVLTVMTAEIDGERQEIASIWAVNVGSHYNFGATLPDGEKISLKIAKAKKQKAETGRYCRKCKIITPYGNHHYCK